MQEETLLAGMVIVTLTLSAAQAAPVAFTRQIGDFVADSGAMSVATGDVDGDGALDLAVANDEADNVSVLWGSGTGTFLDSGAPIAVGVAPFAVALGDFNNDGKLDVVTSDEIGNTVSVLLNQGNRAFVAVAPPTETGGSPQGIVVSDFDGDKFLDVATANSFDGTVTILHGMGDGTFFIAQTAIVGGGIDSEPIGLALADLNHDAHADLVVTNSSGGATGNGSISVLKGVAGGMFEVQPDIPLPTSCGSTACVPVAVTVANLDGDSNPDIVVVNNEGDTVSVFRGNGDLTFQAGTSTTVASSPEWVVAADFDGDGKTDIATSGDFDDKVSVLVGKGDATFEPFVEFDVGGAPYGIATADFNHDGKPDIATANVDDRSVSVLINSTSGAATCVGDCNGGGGVTVDELVTLVRIALSGSDPSACTRGDQNGDGTITVNEIIAAVNSALNGCVQ